ncbi:MAG: prephenate dehydratase [Betaproteobacteria bacterium]|nr:prephenate dehydratase [Betaproteobacteria bacterium]
MAGELKKLRDRIDRLDDEILKLVSQRAAVAKEIGHVKNGLAYRPEREAQVLARIRAANPGPLSKEGVTQLFVELMSVCRALEQPLSVGYLGPRGTFSEEAAVRRFGSGAQAVPCGSIDEVFRKVEAGQVSYGVVPVENSTEGAIGRTLDLLLGTPLKICGEIVLPVHHCLMSRTGAARSVKKIYSHAQSLAQCHEWLSQNFPQAARVPVVSNSEAARLASGEKGTAAIAAKPAAALYALKLVAENIEDEPDNTTRFLVLGRQDVAPSGKDKTSMVMSAKNRPGAVHALLTPLAENGVSMTKLESRPSRTGMWEYVFFLDIEGHQEDVGVARALAELREKAAFLKILGSYPAA